MNPISVLFVLFISLNCYVDGALPRFGVFKLLPENYPEFESWLGAQKIEFGLQSIGWNNWDALIYPGDWLLKPYSQWVNGAASGQNRTFVCSIPMVVDGANLADGAAGKYNTTYKTLANLFKQYNLTGAGRGGAPKTILRFGWEFDGTSFPWHVSSTNDISNFVALWKIMTEIFRAVDPTFKTIWNGQVIYNELSPFQFYPGDAYVDYVAIDIYDKYYLNLFPYATASGVFPVGRGTWDSSFSYIKDQTVEYAGALYQALLNNTNAVPPTATTQWKSVATAAQVLSGRQTAWKTYYNNTDTRFITLTRWSDFARSHSKQMIVQEWSAVSGANGGGDDTYFFQKMVEWMSDPQNNVYYQSWWLEEVAGAMYDIFPSNNGAQKLELKNVSDLYKQTFYISPPITSGAKPITSGAKPITSGAKPITSGAKPITSGAKPITSGAKPITSGAAMPITSGTARSITSGAAPVTSGASQLITSAAGNVNQPTTGLKRTTGVATTAKRITTGGTTSTVKTKVNSIEVTLNGVIAPTTRSTEFDWDNFTAAIGKVLFLSAEDSTDRMKIISIQNSGSNSTVVKFYFTEGNPTSDVLTQAALSALKSNSVPGYDTASASTETTEVNTPGVPDDAVASSVEILRFGIVMLPIVFLFI
uniref:Predicted protein n=1 Tax=Hordeum vulgare subsp. vulgare TaxID=112509 RepID=F2DLA3_HORVV|nr:predicted protein [Hordeum vulgare subsp. vulgare]